MSDSIGDGRTDEPSANPYLRWVDGVPIAQSLDHVPVSLVPIRLLGEQNLARVAGEDPTHTKLLAETEAELPPIVVHRASMRVIDGMHRVRAEISKGHNAIRARILDCDDDTAFLLAVASNIGHGLTLSNADRRAAAERLIIEHADWSDRAVAAATGLSGRTVSTVRAACSTAEVSQSDSRVGLDGRSRPLDSAAARRRAAMMLQNDPTAGIREIARATGLSPATVSDVRRRTRRGEDPVPDRYRRGSEPTRQRGDASAKAPSPVAVSADPDLLLSKLRSDPALRYNETGRQTLRWLYQHMIDPQSCDELATHLPEHWSDVVAQLALNYAQTWRALADRLHEETRRNSGPPPTAALPP